MNLLQNEKDKIMKWTMLPYFGGWVFGIMLVTIGSIITALVRKWTGTEIELIPDTILDFMIEFNSIYIYVPIVLLLGDRGIIVLKLLVALRTGKNIDVNEYDKLENPNESESEMMEFQKQFEQSREK